MNHDLYFIYSNRLMIENKSLEKMFQKIKSIGDYEDTVNRVRSNKRYMNYLKKIVSKIFGEDTPTEAIEDFPYLLVIPGRLSWGHSGFSEFGKRYY